MKFETETVIVLAQAERARVDNIYARHGISPSDGPTELLNEIRLDGANTLSSIFRGWEGVDYAEVVADVANKMEVKSVSTDARENELAILGAVVAKYLENAPTEARDDIGRVLERAGDDFRDFAAALKAGAISATVVRLLIAKAGKVTVARIMTKVIASIAGRQVAKESAKRLAQLMWMAMPILNVALAAWTVIDIAGPAYRKTVPTVIEIALLRLVHDAEEYT